MRWLLFLALLIPITVQPASSQPAGKIYRIGILTAGFVPDRAVGLHRKIVDFGRMLGFEEGRNLEIHWRGAEGEQSRLDGLARELIATNPDLIISISDMATLAIKNVTDRVPVVMVAGDPVATGLVPNLARPGGNITGIVVYGGEADSKRLEILAELQNAKRLAYLVDATVSAASIERVQQAAAKLNVEILLVRALKPADYDSAFRTMQEASVAGLLLSPSLNFLEQANDLAARAAKANLPTICHWREMTQAGCLMSFGTSLEWVFDRVGDACTRILLYGSKPSEMAIEQASKFDLVINTKTAQALGVTIPAALAARASEVID